MEVFANELSYPDPFNTDEKQADEIMKQLLEIYKSSKNTDRPISKIRMPVPEKYNQTCGNIPLTKNLNIHSWIKKQSKTQKDIWLTILISPAIVPQWEHEIEEEYINGDYFVKLLEKEEEVPCEGFKLADLRNTPAFSFLTDKQWEENEIQITIRTHSETEAEQRTVINLSRTEHINSPATRNFFRFPADWEKLEMTEERLKKYFPELTFETSAIDDLNFWRKSPLFRRVFDLLEDIKLNPFVGGKGKTKILKDEEPQICSKRITKGNRITYSPGQHNGEWRVIQCKGHYDDR